MAGEFESDIERIERILGDMVITDTHIVNTSGRHSSVYIDKDRIYPRTKDIYYLCSCIAGWFSDYRIDIVVGPEKGGIILSQWVAYHLSELTGEEVLSYYAEKTVDGGFSIKRGNAKNLIPRKRVLVVEDILTTGGSAKKVIEAVREMKGIVIGLGSLCNRGDVKLEDVAYPSMFYSLSNMNLDSWDEVDCPLCKEGVPINPDLGKGREFLARKKF